MNKYRFNENAISGMIAGIMVLIIVVVGALSILMVSDAFGTQYASVNADPINSTGILANGTPAYHYAAVLTTAINNNIPIAIFLAFLLAVIILVTVIWAMLKGE